MLSEVALYSVEPRFRLRDEAAGFGFRASLAMALQLWPKAQRRSGLCGFEESEEVSRNGRNG
jgi:hypothetical protein